MLGAKFLPLIFFALSGFLIFGICKMLSRNNEAITFFKLNSLNATLIGHYKIWTYTEKTWKA